jgi:ketose-bisphosphate aldolase
VYTKAIISRAFSIVMKKILGYVVGIAILGIPLISLAAEFRTGEQPTITKDEQVADDIYMVGGSVTSAGTVAGDVVAGGGNVVISGPVSGDVLTGGGNVTILSNVADDVRVGGGNIVIEGRVREMLERARAEGYAIGAFNTVNLETTRGIVLAAKEVKSPVILQVTEKTFDYAGGRAIFHLIKDMAESYAPEIPVGIHLDHGKSFEVVERAMEIGFPSVMYDGSRKEYADNLMTTRKIVELAHLRGISVQAELGNVPYLGEVNMDSIHWDKYMTDPAQAAEFVKETGIDTLAVAIGNAHGFFKEREVPDYDRLQTIASQVSIPLVLHGSSDWDEERVRKVIEMGISCFNVDTSIRLGFIGAIKQHLEEHEETDIRRLLGGAMASVSDVVKQKIAMYGGGGRA